MTDYATLMLKDCGHQRRGLMARICRACRENERVRFPACDAVKESRRDDRAVLEV